MKGQYYLHSNGSLIHKSVQIDDPDSNFVVCIWNDADIGKSPETFLTFLKDARREGAKKEEIERLANHNKLDTFIPNWRNQVFGDST